MPSTYSPALRLELIGNGEQAANWGNTTNTNLGTLLEQAITGVANITMSGASTTLISGNGISDQARNAVLVLGGTLGSAANLVVPTSNKFYAVRNATTGGYTVTVKTSAGTGVALTNGFTQLMYCDGTNVVAATAAFNTTTGSLGNIVVGSVTASSAVISGSSSGDLVRITQTGAGNALVVEDSANPDSTPFVITSAGDVGIGISSPPQLLAVGNSVDQFGAGVSGVVTTAYFGSPSSGSGGIKRIAYDRSTGGLSIIGGTVASPSTQMTVDNSGNVGIGTASPAQKLDVAGSIKASNYFAINQATTDAVTFGFGNSNGPAILTWGSATAQSGALAFLSAGAERARIDSSGNFGIGTTSPTQKLSVSGNTAITGNITVSGDSTVSGNSSVAGNLNVTGTITAGGGLFPPGSIIEYGGSSAPTGWLLCDGSAVSRAVYSALFAVLGTAYGAGDGSTTFNLPDKRGKFGVGVNGTYTRGSSGGSTTTSSAGSHDHTGNAGATTLSTSQIPAHTHTGSTSTASLTGGFGPFRQTLNSPDATASGVFSLGAQFGSGDANNGSRNTRSINMDASHGHSFTTDSTGGTTSHTHTISTDGTHTHTVTPPYLASNFIIKT